MPCHVAGVRAWASMTPPQILHAVAVEGRKPKFLDGVPADFQVCALSIIIIIIIITHTLESKFQPR